MPNSGVISFVIKLEDDLFLCWDAEKSTIRYMWRGSFDPSAHFTSNGKSLPKVIGDTFYKELNSPFTNIEGKVKFKGYKITDQELPEFMYSRGHLDIREVLKYEEGQLTLTYKINGADELHYKLPKIANYSVSASSGINKNDVLQLNSKQMQNFSIIIKEEK